MKKYVSILLTAIMLFSVLALAGCNQTTSEDLDYVKDKGTLVVGVIDAPPLTEMGDEGEWTGFSVDLAKRFGDELGVEVVFKEIDWDEMEHLLDDKTIDCVSSALTLTAERRAVMECTKAYINNSQILVTKSENTRKYTSAEDCLQARIAVLDGSTHEQLAKDNGFVILAKETTDDALKAVENGTADAAIINSIFAETTIGEGNEFSGLARSFSLKDNKMGFAFRKGSGLAAEMNNFFVTTYTSGLMTTMAEKYSLDHLLVEQVTEE